MPDPSLVDPDWAGEEERRERRSTDTGAGTPLTDPIEDFLEMLPGSLGEDKEITLALYRLVDHERAAARTPPATDPAGLDVERLAIENDLIERMLAALKRTDDAIPGSVLDHVYTKVYSQLATAAENARKAARLSVADGPGPEERPDLEAAVREWVAAEDGVHGTDPAPSREAWDRAFAARAGLRAALPVHREEPTDG